MERLTPYEVFGCVIALFVAAVVISTLVGRSRRKKLAAAVATHDAELATRELAVIVEQIHVTSGGVVSFVLLIITVVGSVFAYGAAATVFQQIEAGVSLIAGSILFGLGTALGRSRTYRVYRSEHREPI